MTKSKPRWFTGDIVTSKEALRASNMQYRSFCSIKDKYFRIKEITSTVVILETWTPPEEVVAVDISEPQLVWRSFSNILRTIFNV